MLPVFIVTAVFIFVLFITKIAMDHTARMKELESPQRDNSLAASELKALIAEAVVEATRGLETRMDRLEERLQRLPAAELPAAESSSSARLTAAPHRELEARPE